MNILFLGDVVGKVGRQIVDDQLSFIKEKYKIDFTIVNGENSAHGKGITTKIYKNFKNIFKTRYLIIKNKIIQTVEYQASICKML